MAKYSGHVEMHTYVTDGKDPHMITTRFAYGYIPTKKEMQTIQKDEIPNEIPDGYHVMTVEELEALQEKGEE